MLISLLFKDTKIGHIESDSALLYTIPRFIIDENKFGVLVRMNNAEW